MHRPTHSHPFIVLLALAAVALTAGIHLAPLFLEEPRRALVAMEMMYSGDYLHTTIHGAPYYNKPPLFNWFLATGFRLFGMHEWVPRSITVASHLLLAWLTYRMGCRYLNPVAALAASAYYLVGSSILFYFSLIGEIDLFFSLLIVAAWFALFHFHQQNRLLAAFGWYYFFMSLGFLTKGFPSLVFCGFSLLAWFGYLRKMPQLLTWQHAAGFFVLVLVMGAYSIPFLAAGDAQTLYATLWSQSLERTAAGISWSRRLLSLVLFPLQLFADVVPGSLFLLLISRRKWKAAVAAHPLMAFCVVVFVANVWVYWVSPGTASRYHYMFHPLMMLVAAHFCAEAWRQQGLAKVLRLFLRYLPLLLVVVCVAGAVVLPYFIPTRGIGWVLPATALLMLGLYAWHQKVDLPHYLLAPLVLIALRFGFGWVVSAERGQHSQAARDKQTAGYMAKMIGSDKVYLLDSTRISYTISYYLQRDLKRIVPFKQSPAPGDWVIAPDSLLSAGLRTRLAFTYRGVAFGLARW
jgi:4-amino-4-deoxy-L-arabinose transferase-like glycosyltransferase